MSKDLLEAFGVVDEQALPHRSGQQQPIQKFSFFDDIDQPSQCTREDAAADDDWGEFEGPSTGEQGAFGSIEKNLTINDSGSSPNRKHEARDPNILFDASSEHLPSEDDDEQGVFGSIENLTINDSGSSPNRKHEARDPNILFDASEHLPSEDDDEPWDDFTGWEANVESTASTNPTAQLPFSIPASSKSPPPEPVNAQPPTNVPPPAILLSLFPPLLASLSTSFFQPLASLPPSTRSTIYTNPVAITYLKSYLALATVCARLLAGRKLRWKRDALLSQAMRIGPAAGGGAARGMKVTSVDRAEMQREEREVADVMRAWQGEVGRLRGAVAEVRKGATGTEREDGFRVPEIRDGTVVRSVGAGEGGVKSVRPCALCGLMREERVDKVDGDVFDGFDEWWVEKMNMHRTCRNFWLEHEEKLRQR